ncbi:MAG: hypothetical protein ACREDO_11870 [Methyloceanibacter sp.]
MTYYRRMLGTYLKEWTSAPLSRIDGTALANLRKRLHEEHGPDAARMVLRLLRAAWHTAQQYDGRLPAFPRLPRGATSGGDPKKSPIKGSDLPGWFANVERIGGQRKDVWLLGIMTGLRRNDLNSIKRSHVTGCTLSVPCPKGGAARAFALPLSDAACELVQRVLCSHNSEWLWPSAKSKSGHIEDPDPKADDGFLVAWTIHDLRRIYASAAAAVVTNGYHLKTLMNHALPKSDVTAGYIELETDDLRPSQQAVTERLRKFGLPL